MPNKKNFQSPGQYIYSTVQYTVSLHNDNVLVFYSGCT